jgi:voltage-gated potassium channel
VIWAVFVAELAFILTVAPRKAAALRAHWLDAVVVVVTAPVYAPFSPRCGWVRLARLLRLLRPGAILTRILQRERALSSGATFRFIGLVTVLVVVVSGGVESVVDSGDFPSVWQGIWWSSQ